MSRILVLGGSGEMGSAAVADLVERTDHELTIGDIRPDAAAALLRRLGAPERVVRVDVDAPASLAAALADSDVVLNATYMRHNVPVTDAAIAAGVHLVDLGSYYPETLQQLERHERAVAAGCRIVPGCGVAPGLTNILARHGADRLDSVDAVRLYSYITHPMWTSPGIVVTRFDASTGTSLVLEGGRLVEHPSFTGEEEVVFPAPYGAQAVHLVPHPEPVTLPRSLAVSDVVFKVGYPADETRRIEVLLELGFDRDEPFELDGVAISPRRFAAGYIGRRGIGPSDRSANVKQVRVEGIRHGTPVTLVYDFAVEHIGRSASSAITGTVAAIAADLVSRDGPLGVHPPEGAFDAAAFLAALAERGFTIAESEVARSDPSARTG
ncbi:MAG TPA: saccharopine dehydrogenase NADP-binding domain-containing protein [Candidatus Limnocylindrales bacterium]|nr:saccharopine dehydrogenase NADP-binding domain-containing protein [Candidatus Limnocylindrales bacterium]